MTADIESICAKDTCIGSTCAVGTWIGCAGIGSACTRSICARGVFAGDVKLRALARLGVILAGLGVYDCCFIGLVFALIDGVSF